MGRRVYNDAEKARALDLYRAHGASYAARETGINAATIRSWASRNGDATLQTETTAAATHARLVRWAERRLDEADAAGDLADTARAAMQEAIRQRDPEMLRALVPAYGVAVDKAQLLSGEATSRSEEMAGDKRARLAAVIDELADARSRRGA